jgi:hypothetical protein
MQILLSVFMSFILFSSSMMDGSARANGAGANKRLINGIMNGNLAEVQAALAQGAHVNEDADVAISDSELAFKPDRTKKVPALMFALSGPKQWPAGLLYKWKSGFVLNPAIVELLLKYRAAIEDRDEDKIGVLEYAMNYLDDSDKKHREILENMLFRGADVNYERDAEHPLLDISRLKPNFVRLLLNYHFDESKAKKAIQNIKEWYTGTPPANVLEVKRLLEDYLKEIIPSLGTPKPSEPEIKEKQAPQFPGWTRDYDRAAQAIGKLDNPKFISSENISKISGLLLKYDLKGNIKGPQGTLLDIARTIEKTLPSDPKIVSEWSILMKILEQA